MNVDYIVVGFGLAGLAFVEELERNNKSFIVFDSDSQNSSQVASGVYNPVILKRFTPVWDAEDQLGMALPFYKSLERKLLTKFDEELDIFRIFVSIEEQNNWFNACDKPFFKKFLIPEIVQNSNKNILAKFGLGKVVHTGKIDTRMLLRAYKDHLKDKNQIKVEKFDYSLLKIEGNSIVYKNVTAGHIVFCEGFGIKKNPYFKEIPLQGSKGELLTIYAPELNFDYILKSSVFVIPIGDDYYKVGATFNRNDKTTLPTDEGKEELLIKLKKIITCDFEIVEHMAGIRPTVKDRRPLLGKHIKYNRVALFNGLGTRGVMLAPKMARLLYDHIENETPLPKEVDINRFE